jgi:hypothetical protein
MTSYFKTASTLCAGALENGQGSGPMTQWAKGSLGGHSRRGFFGVSPPASRSSRCLSTELQVALLSEAEYVMWGMWLALPLQHNAAYGTK